MSDVVKAMKKKVDYEIEDKMEKDTIKVTYVAKTIHAMRLKQNLEAMKKDQRYSNALLDVKFSELQRELQVLSSKFERS